MREELKRLKRDVRRNEAIIEYMELRGAFTPSMRSIGDIAKHIVAKAEATGGPVSYTHLTLPTTSPV